MFMLCLYFIKINTTPTIKDSKACKRTTDPKHWNTEKKIPSFLSGDDEPMVQNNNSVCRVFKIYIYIDHILWSMIVTLRIWHNVSTLIRVTGGNTYAETETQLLFGYGPWNLSLSFQCQSKVLKACFVCVL